MLNAILETTGISIAIGIGLTIIYLLSNFQTLTLVLLLGLLIKLTMTSELALLIHPRFFWLVWLTIAFIVAILIFTKKDQSKLNNGKLLTLVVLNVFTILGTIVDFQPLSAMAQPEALATEFNNSQNLSRQKRANNFALNTTELELEDWVTIFSANPEPSNYQDKPAKITGFYHVDATGNPMIAKYVVSCCAADARLMGLWLTTEIDVPTNTWLEISGNLQEITINDQRAIGLKINEHQIITTPKNPYVTK